MKRINSRCTDWNKERSRAIDGARNGILAGGLKPYCVPGNSLTFLSCRISHIPIGATRHATNALVFYGPFRRREAPSSDDGKSRSADDPSRSGRSCGKCNRKTTPGCKVLVVSILVGGTGPKAYSIKSSCSFGCLLRDHRRMSSSAREIMLPSAPTTSSPAIICATRLSSSKLRGQSVLTTLKRLAVWEAKRQNRGPA